MYTSVPRAHHEIVDDWRDASLRVAEAPLALLVKVSRAGTGLTNVATEEGQGCGILRRCKRDVGRMIQSMGSHTSPQQWRVHYCTFAGLGRHDLRHCMLRDFEVELGV